MISTEKFADALIKEYSFFAGVPDSVLKDLCAALSDRLQPDQFTTSANEGSAVALCAGYTLATGKPGVVYMQNSGLGNAANPLLSLNDTLVYSIPVLLIIGWRGEPGVIDEPQHKKQGLITCDMLDAFGIPWRVVSGIEDIGWASKQLLKTSAPVALLVKKGIFNNYKRIYSNTYKLSRETAIETVIDMLTGNNYRIVSTTGMISRELYALRESRGESHSDDFIAVGSMGHASAIALGFAIQRPELNVVCLDGDGSVLMHMGSLATIGASEVSNFTHIVFNNAAHDSVGGQSTVADEIDLFSIAKACGYSSAEVVYDVDAMRQALLRTNTDQGKHFIEVKVSLRENNDLIRPPSDLEVQKRLFMLDDSK